MVDARRAYSTRKCEGGNFMQPEGCDERVGMVVFVLGGKLGDGEWRSKCSNLRYDNCKRNNFYSSRNERTVNDNAFMMTTYTRCLASFYLFIYLERS